MPVDALPEAVIVTDVDYRVTSWNAAAERLFGWRADEVIGRLPPILDASELAALRSQLARATATPLPWRDARRQRKDGTRVDVSISAAALFDDDGRRVGQLAIVRDRSAQEQTELALRETRREVERQREQLRAILNAEPDAVMLLDGDGRLLDNNPAGLALLEVESVAALGGRPVRELVVPTDRARFDAAHGEARAGRSGTAQVELVGAGGARRRLEVRTVPVRAECGAPATLAIARDITEQHRAAEALRESEAKFAGIVSIAADAIIAMDEEHRVVLFNHAAEEIFGYEARDILGEPIERLLPEDAGTLHQPHVLAAHSARPARPAHLRPKVRGRRKDGTLFPAEASVARLELEGRLLVAAVLRDATERERTEALLDARARQQAMVARLSQEALGGVPLSQLLQRAATVVASTLGVEFSYVAELLHDSGRLAWRASHGWQQYRVELSLPCEAAARSMYTLERNASVVVADVATEQRFAVPEYLRAAGVRSGLCVILRGDERPYGVLAVDSLRQRGFSKQDVNFVESVANVLTAAIERARVEEALRQSEVRFRSLIENGSEPVSIIDANAVAQYTSPAFERVLGYGAGELASGNLLALVHPDDLPAVQRALEELVRHPAGTRVVELRVLHRDGSWRTFISTGSNMLHDPAIGGIVVNSRDITERTEAEAVLRASEARFRSIMEHSSDLVAVLDGDGALRYASPAYNHGLGHDPAALLGTSAFGLVHPDDVAECRAMFDQLLGTPAGMVAQEIRLRHRHEGWRIYSVSAKNLLADPAVRGIIIMGRDVTNERALEEQLRQSQKMEAIGQLAGGVAHDFNNLLTVIKVHAELLLDDLRQEDPRHDDVQEIARASTRAASLTRQLLAFSRRQILQPRVLDIGEVVRDLEPMLRRLIPEDVRVIVESPGSGVSVHADRGQLEQVLLNLAVNARDAMASGGTLRIEVTEVEAGDARMGRAGARRGRYVGILVSDTGVGMTPEVVARIFEPFFTTKEVGKGTGLGLATVYGIVQQSGGHVLVDSEPGEGSTFTILLPRADRGGIAMAGTPGIAPASTPPAHGTILLVEDELAVRKLARRVLAAQGYAVLEAANGREALEVATLHDGRVDLVLSDVIMPEMGGRRLVERLRERWPAVPVIFMSGYTDDEVLRRGLVDPGSGFLQKPFSPASLSVAVQAALSEAA